MITNFWNGKLFLFPFSGLTLIMDYWWNRSSENFAIVSNITYDH